MIRGIIEIPAVMFSRREYNDISPDSALGDCRFNEFAERDHSVVNNTSLALNAA